MGEQPLLVFVVSGVGLALSAHQVDAVSALDDPTPIPGAPPHILGVVASGERVLPLVDLSALLELEDRSSPAEAATLFPRTLVVRDGEFEAGLVCHRVRGLVPAESAALHPPSVLQGNRLRTFVSAELESPHGVVGVLDLTALLHAAAVP